MREHQRHDAVRLQHPPTLREDGRHALLVVPSGEGAGTLPASESRRVGDGLVLLVRELAAEQFGEDVASGALEPDVEEVRKLRVHHVVVVGRVHDHRVDAGVGDVIEAVGGFAGDGDRRWFWRLLGGLVDEVVVVALRAQEFDEFLDALGSLREGPVVAETSDQWCHLRMRPAKSEIVPVERVGHYFARWHPDRHSRVVVEQLVQGQRQVAIGRLPRFRELASRPIRFKHLPKHFHADAVAE